MTSGVVTKKYPSTSKRCMRNYATLDLTHYVTIGATYMGV